jgi:Asp-tRNA(Asn)/Glu-tRNA(Gln) amidotransferase A subunit family amidase
VTSRSESASVADAPGSATTLRAALDRLLAEYRNAVTALASPRPPTRSKLAVRRPTAQEDPYRAFIHCFELERRRVGSLAGRAIAVKDAIAITGVPRTRGRVSGWDEPDHDATVIERVLEAGGRIVGTLAMDAWSASATGEGCEFGVPANPKAPGRLPGGSSCGAGTAVAAGLVDLALGTDSAGSARIPASWCGVVALKPTHGAIPADGVVGLDPTLDDVCPIAATVDDCRALFEILARGDAAGAAAAVRVGLVAGTDSGCDEGTRTALAAAAVALAEAGCSVRSVRIPLWEHAWQIESILLGCSVPYLVRTGWQGRFALDPVRAAVPASDPPPLVALWELALRELGDEANHLYEVAHDARARLRAATAAAFEQVDCLLTPTTPTTAPRPCAAGEGGLLATTSGAATPVQTSTLTTPANLTGIPALAVPFRRDDEGAPCSVQLHTRWNDEALLFAVGTQLEEAA